MLFLPARPRQEPCVTLAARHASFTVLLGLRHHRSCRSPRVQVALEERRDGTLLCDPDLRPGRPGRHGASRSLSCVTRASSTSSPWPSTHVPRELGPP
ncbi:hypothetical protein ACRAWF_33855 [Streptomyces sp. L7]